MESSWEKRRVSARYNYGSYHTNAPFIALSTWSRAKKYIMCGTPTSFGPARCRLHCLCEQCARTKASVIYKRYEHSYHRAQHWYALTYSFKSNVFLDKVTKEEYLQRWKQADSFIRKLKADGLLLGAFAVEELSINNISSKALFPHTHVVFCSDRADLTNEDKLLHPLLAQESALPNVSIQIKKITSELTFFTELKYPIKPINLKALYEQEAINTSYDTLNISLDYILGKTTEFERHHQKVRYYGSMDPRCKSSYLGTKMYSLKNSRTAKKTKELNCSPVSSTIKAVTVNKPISVHQYMITKYAAPVLPPVMPPQQKKRRPSNWNPLLGVAGAASLGAGADLLLNKGRIVNPIFQTIKNYFTPGASTSAKPVQPKALSHPVVAAINKKIDVEIGKPTEELSRFRSSYSPDVALANVLADAGASRSDPKSVAIGNTPDPTRLNPADLTSYNQHNDPERFIDYQRNIGEISAFNTGNPVTTPEFLAQYSQNPAQAEETTNILLGRDLEKSFDTGIYPDPALIRLVDQSRPLNRALTDTQLVAKVVAENQPNAVVQGLERTLNNTMYGELGAAGGLYAVGRAANSLPNVITKHLPTLRKGLGAFGRVTGAGTSALIGYDIGNNELIQEAYGATTPGQQNALTAAMTAGSVGLGLAVPASVIPMVVTQIAINKANDEIRAMSASAAERGALGDILSRFIEGAKQAPTGTYPPGTGPEDYKRALRHLLPTIYGNQELMKTIEFGNPSMRTVAKNMMRGNMSDEWSGRFFDVAPSPTVYHLIEKVRQMVTPKSSFQPGVLSQSYQPNNQ